MIIGLELADMTLKLKAKKKQIEQFRGGLDLLEKRVNELLKRMNRKWRIAEK